MWIAFLRTALKSFRQKSEIFPLGAKNFQEYASFFFKMYFSFCIIFLWIIAYLLENESEINNCSDSNGRKETRIFLKSVHVAVLLKI